MNVPLNIDWQQIFLHLFNFAILATGLYLLLYKPVKDFMDKRTEYYRNLELAAQKKLSEAEETKADYDKRIRNVDEEINQWQADALKNIEQTRAFELQKTKEQAEKILQDAKKEAEKEHDRMMDDAQKEVVDLVTVAAKKMLLQSTASESFDQFLEAAERSVQRE